jgi:hypothetical protein
MFQLAPDVDLPADAPVQTFAFLARRGAGKTYNAGKLAETLLDGGAQVVVLDPVGVWYGLRLDASGGPGGIPIPVFGGLRGDIALAPGSGELVAELVAARRQSVVLDVSDFSSADQRRFATDFAEHLYSLKKRHRTPMHLIVDEAQEFVPQNPMPGEQRMLGAFLRLWRVGRNFGIGGTLISQRPQAVSKSALNLTEVLVTGQLTGPHERKTIAGWVTDQGMDAKALAELPSLPVGTVYLWSPQWLRMMVRTRFHPKRTMDTSASPKEFDPDDVEVRALAPVDLEKIRGMMGKISDQKETDDPKVLRARIAELQRNLISAGGATGEAVYQLQRERDTARENLDRCMRSFEEASRKHGEMWRTIKAALDATETMPGIPIGVLPGDPAPTLDAEIQRLNTALPNPPGKRFSIEDLPRDHRGDTAVMRAFTRKDARAPNDGSTRMLIALAEVHPKALTYRQLGTLAVMKPSGGSFPTYLSRLGVQGYITREGGLVRLTPAGRAAAGDVLKPATARELLAMWREKLPGKAADMLEWLAAERTPKTRAELADFARLEIKGGTFPTYLSKLTANGLAERAQGNRLRAVEELWLR